MCPGHWKCKDGVDSSSIEKCRPEDVKEIERGNWIIQTIIRQILFALDGLHSTGIVHRDIKPQKIIFSEESCAFKINDLGPAADLQVWINCVPKESLLDPRTRLHGIKASPTFTSYSFFLKERIQLEPYSRQRRRHFMCWIILLISFIKHLVVDAWWPMTS